MSVLRPALDLYASQHQPFDPEDRAQTVGASDVGQCERKVYYYKNERDWKHAAPRDEEYQDRWGAKIRGSVFENQFWYPALKATFGDRLKFAGPDQQTFVSGFLSATPDGLLTGCQLDEIAPGSGAEVIVEAKTADPRTNLTKPKEENVFQTQVQMGRYAKRPNTSRRIRCCPTPTPASGMKDRSSSSPSTPSCSRPPRRAPRGS
jgi:hypothetical protein